MGLRNGLSSIIKNTIPKNELNYNPSTWSEWIKPTGVIGDSTGFEITANGSSYVITSIPTNLKTSTKYGYLVNVVSNTISTLSKFNMANSRTSTNIWNLGTLLGNQKFIDTSKASISNNSLVFAADPTEANGNKIKLKDIRVFELPTGSQIESDFTNLTADQLNLKYPYGIKNQSNISNSSLH